MWKNATSTKESMPCSATNSGAKLYQMTQPNPISLGRSETAIFSWKNLVTERRLSPGNCIIFVRAGPCPPARAQMPPKEQQSNEKWLRLGSAFWTPSGVTYR